MIEIQRPEQFTKAAARLLKEPQAVRPHSPGLYEITNKVKGNTYLARVTRFDGKLFIHCDCYAGNPPEGNRAPLVCKHVAALVIFLRAVREMRRRGVEATAAASEEVSDTDNVDLETNWHDADDPDCDERNWQ
jgi:hypothetical protein